DALDQKLTSLSDEAESTTLQQTLDALDQKLTALADDTSLSSLQEALGTLQEAFTAEKENPQTERFDALEARLKTLEESIQSIAESTKEDTVTPSIEELTQNIQTIEASIATLAETQPSQAAAVDTTPALAEQLKQATQALQAQLAQQQTLFNEKFDSSIGQIQQTLAAKLDVEPELISSLLTPPPSEEAYGKLYADHRESYRKLLLQTGAFTGLFFVFSGVLMLLPSLITKIWWLKKTLYLLPLSFTTAGVYMLKYLDIQRLAMERWIAKEERQLGLPPLDTYPPSRVALVTYGSFIGLACIQLLLMLLH
ncbi:MAG TPA: hypothetical protein DCE42_17485, partial [Myxococcales bacterium]|nr:hypothetical protein [Myxococcales bacterium]